MKFNKKVLISAFSLGAIFVSSSLAEQSNSFGSGGDSSTNEQGTRKTYRLTGDEKREIEEQSLQLHLQEMKASPQKGDNPFGTGAKE
jgi:hypothetical protein